MAVEHNYTIPEVNEKWFPIEVKFFEHNNEIKTLSYQQYLENKRSFLTLRCNVK